MSLTPRTWWAVIMLVAVAVAGLSSASAQHRRRPATIPGEIRGQVRVAGTEHPLRGVMVRLESDAGEIIQQVTTDDLGKFTFSPLAPVVYYVTVHCPGFLDVRERADLTTAPRTFIQVRLMASSEEEPSIPPSVATLLSLEAPEPIRREMEKVREDLAKNKLSSARHRLEKILASWPHLAEAQFLLGTVYADVGDVRRAEMMLRRAIELDERLAGAYFALGELYNTQKRFADAETILVAGLKLAEASWQGHFSLAKTYWGLGDVNRARDHALRAHQLNPDPPLLHLLLGNIYLRSRQPERALQEFKEYLEREPLGPFADQARDIIKKIERALAGSTPQGK